MVYIILFGLIASITFLLSLQHANGENAWTGIDGNSGVIADMKELKVQIFSYLDENVIMQQFYVFIFLYFCRGCS